MAMADGCVFSRGRMRSISMTRRRGSDPLKDGMMTLPRASITPSAVSPVTSRSGAAQPYPMMPAEVSTDRNILVTALMVS
jgi:hypothetical protein